MDNADTQGDIGFDTRGDARTIDVGGAELAVETFGEPEDPVILLLAGIGSSMDPWDDEFCRRLAAGRRFVIRYDHRDTGRSTSWPAGEPGYTSADLTSDPVALLDGLGVAAAHLVGVSMGGGIAQDVAYQHPDRVASLTLIATSPAGPGDPQRPPLPAPAERVQRTFDAPPPDPDWSDREAVIRWVADAERPYAGEIPLDEARLRATAERTVDRARNSEAAAKNHWLLEEGSPEGAEPTRIDRIAAPTLVLHGTADPLFPFAHGEALAREIPGATLVPLPGMGHQFPPPETWDVVVPAILKHTSGGWEAQADRLAARSLAEGDPTRWFDELYRAGSADEAPMPWDRADGYWLLQRWAGAAELGPVAGTGRRAVVVGCGLGADAAYLARQGFETIGFDVSETAIAVARRRFPDAGATYVTADLLDLPESWSGSFDLVLEIFTVQALPRALRSRAAGAVRSLVAPGGTLVLIAAVADDDADVAAGPPFPFTRAEIDAIAGDGLSLETIEAVPYPGRPDDLRWLAVFRRRPAA